MIEALPADRSDHPFCVRVLPRRTRGRPHRVDTQPVDRALDRGKHRVSIVHEIPRRRILRKRLAQTRIVTETSFGHEYVVSRDGAS